MASLNSANRINRQITISALREDAFQRSEGGQPLASIVEIAIVAVGCKLKGRQRALAADK